jgi:outer membrane protein assembly factor BamB
VDGRVFTQEQRGGNEAVVCRDAAGGEELWSHEEPGRFSEALSSLGPRATPTFSGNRVYAQGAAGNLVCLDAATGQKMWSRDVLADAGPDAKVPDWGVCSSPLVMKDGIVVVFAAGQSKKGLLGYRADTGEPAWAADAGVYSYSSPQPATIGGREQVLFVGNTGLSAVEPATGTVLWTYGVEGQPPRSLQPMPLGDDRLLVPMGMEVPTDLVEVKRAGDTFAATKKWTSRNLKPSFNDFVVHKGYVYGFDGAIFTCVDLKTGERKWKQGRYGTGQVLLIEDSSLLLVLSDKGEVILLSAKPDAFEELGQLQAISGKTWNHPAIAQGRLYVRNAEEMACYELPVAPAKERP